MALRELTVNAVAHRDWSYCGAYIRIQMFPDCIEWISPGGFPGRAPKGVSPETQLHTLRLACAEGGTEDLIEDITIIL